MTHILKFDTDRPQIINDEPVLSISNSVESSPQPNLQESPVNLTPPTIAPTTPTLQATPLTFSSQPASSTPDVSSTPIKPNEPVTPEVTIPEVKPEELISKSSSFSLPKPRTGFRSVTRPVKRTQPKVQEVSKQKNEPVAMTYADIMAAKERQQHKIEEPPPPPKPQAVNAIADDYQNTSDDAESIPTSFQEPSDTWTDKTPTPEAPNKPEMPADPEEIDDSSISEVHQEELKNSLTNHSRVPSRSRKRLVKAPLTSLDQIPEEKSLHLNEESNSTTSFNATDSDRTPRPEKPDRNEPKKRRKRRSKGQVETPKELTPEERAANEEKLKKEYEEFAQKQKELEKAQKELEKEQKREKKKRKKSKKTEEVKVMLLKSLSPTQAYELCVGDDKIELNPF